MNARDMLDLANARIAAAGCEDPKGDALALVGKALEMSIGALSNDGDTPVSVQDQLAIEELIQRREDREPLAYILGYSEFRTIKLMVDPRVLVPREETGLLVDVASRLPEGARVHEVGTGSGAVALALLMERPDLEVTASDLSPDAVDVARKNAEHLGISLEVTVAKGLPEGLGKIDMILANLPYVTDETIYERSPEIRREPRIAVTGACGADGLGVIQGLIEETPSGWRMGLEHDTHHGPEMKKLLHGAETLKDHRKEERVTVGIAR